MAVLPTDIKYYQSIDTDSLGGAIDNEVVPTGLNLYYSDVDYPEADSGSQAYRCMYVKNESVADTLLGAQIYVAKITNSPSTSIEIGLGSSGFNGIEQSVTTESVPPVGVVFSTYTTNLPLLIGDLGPDSHHAIWIKRNVLPNAVGTASDNVILAVRGDGGS